MLITQRSRRILHHRFTQVRTIPMLQRGRRHSRRDRNSLRANNHLWRIPRVNGNSTHIRSVSRISRSSARIQLRRNRYLVTFITRDKKAWNQRNGSCRMLERKVFIRARRPRWRNANGQRDIDPYDAGCSEIKKKKRHTTGALQRFMTRVFRFTSEYRIHAGIPSKFP